MLGYSLIATTASAATISFEASDFNLNTTFNEVSSFDFTIEIQGALAIGVAYSDPVLVSVDYSVSGTLPEGSPSNFSGFALSRPEAGGLLTGTEFYAQGSSLSFEISATADLSDGLQLNELVGDFIFDGLEVGTGRYHPALFIFDNTGTGTIANSNNNGGVNPGSGQVVNVAVGDEYITDVTVTDASSFTLSDNATVPEPSSLILVTLASLLGTSYRRR